MRLKRWRELLEFFYVQRIKGFDVPNGPMLEPRAAQFLKERLAKAKMYVEYGSGGSTLLADRMGIRTVSVDSDRFYAAAVRKRLTGSHVTIMAPNIGMTAPWGYPLFRRPTRRRRERWRRYVEAPFQGQSPDIVLVDGRCRVACTLEAARRAYESKHPAVLIFEDYAWRPQYGVVERYLGAPRMIGRAAVFEIGRKAVPRLAVDDLS